MDTHGKTILVTGATGNQGGATARRLLADGWHVRALVRDSQNRFYLEHGWGSIDKWRIEEHIRGLGVPATILRPAGFMEDLTSPARFFQNGSLNVPWRDDLVMQLIAIDDIGAFAALAFAKPDQYLGRAMEITGDKLTTPQIADALRTAAGRLVPHTRIPLEVLWDRSPAAAKVFTWANETYYDTDLAPLRAALVDLMDFATWLERSGRARLLTQLEALPA
jgi:uncharacterized protein YbjT (DUF2867 family)